MKWEKLGRVYVPDGSLWWAKTHATLPTPVIIDDETVRIYITSRDEDGIGRAGFVDVDAREPTKVINIGAEPILDIGQPGTFDENGVVVSSAVPTDERNQYLYYTGFELGTRIRYRLLSGLAVCKKGQSKFVRAKRVPILERNDDELFFRCAPYVLKTEAGFEMWYVAGSDWEKVNGVSKPVYDIRYMRSDNGIDWPLRGESCVNIEKQNEHGFGRPYIIDVMDKRLMFYSIRLKDLASYRMGYAELSKDDSWIRKDEAVGIDVSDSGWDSEMVCFPAVIHSHNKTYMFYSGNNFGETGFGVAVLK